jgi:hypothetical protein
MSRPETGPDDGRDIRRRVWVSQRRDITDVVVVMATVSRGDGRGRWRC